MMKWALAVFAAVTLASTASAGVVDFFGTYGALGGCDATLTYNAAGCTVSGVTFSYDPTGDPLVSGTGAVSGFGVDVSPGTDTGGYIGGVLTMVLSGPVLGGLSFDFTVYGTAPGDALILTLLSGGTPIYSTFSYADSGGLGILTTIYPGVAWDSAAVNFAVNPAAAGVNVNDVNVDIAPEPGTYALLGPALLLLGFGGRKLAGRRSS